MCASGPWPEQGAISVLLIEEDEDIRLVLRSILEEAGYHVTETVAVREGQTYLQRDSTPPSVVLLDYRFPSGPAGALLRVIASNSTLSRHCYVLLPDTQLSFFPSAEQQLIATTCLEVVYKPFDIEDVVAAVTRAARLLAIYVSVRGH